MTNSLCPTLASLRKLASYTLALLLVSAPALAGGGADEEGKTAELIWQAINLAILLAVLFFAARKPIKVYFADRRQEIQSDIQKADQLLAESRRQFSEWQGKLAELEQQVATIRDETRQRAQDEGEQIIAAAHDSAERIKTDAVAAIDQELRRAHTELREEAATLAIDLAQGMLSDQIDDRDRDRLMDEFIMSVEPGSNGQGR